MNSDSAFERQREEDIPMSELRAGHAPEELGVSDADLVERMREHIVEGVDDLERAGFASSRQRLSDAADALGARIGDERNDLVSLTRRYPIPALLIAVGVGYLLARNM